MKRKTILVYITVISLLLAGCGMSEVTDIYEKRLDEALDALEGEKASEKLAEAQDKVESVLTEALNGNLPNVSGETKEDDGAEVVVYDAPEMSLGYYGYESLDDDLRAVYDQIYSCIMNQEETVVLSTLDTDALYKAYTVVLADHGELFWCDGYKFTAYSTNDEVTKLEFSPNYTLTPQERQDYQAQVDAVVDDWLSGISKEASQYEKSKYVFELLLDKVTYDLNAPNNQNILSVFLGQSTVCQGYAESTQYLLRKLGINSVVITGTANGGPHAWNLVNVEGEYYFTDTTWGNSSYLNGELDGGDTKHFNNYTYLNMTGADLKGTHADDGTVPLPVCDSTISNYFYREGLYFEDNDDEAVGNVIKEAYENGEGSVTLKFADAATYDHAFNYFLGDQHISDYCKGLKSLMYLNDDHAHTLMIMFE